MRREWGVLLAASLGLMGLGLPGCDLPGLSVSDAPSSAPTLLDPAERAEMVRVFREFLTTQQARQQVNITSTTLIAGNSAGILSNNAASLTQNAPLISNGGSTLISNGGSSYRLAVARDQAPSQHHALPDGNHFYRLGNTGDTFIETFVTRTANSAVESFDVPDADVLVHGEMRVTPADYSETDVGDWLYGMGTNHYAIKVLKSPVLEGYTSDVWITAPMGGGPSQQYVENAAYEVGGLSVTAEATHSSFAGFNVDGKNLHLPTSGEERIRIGGALLDLNYQNVSGQGVGSGTWKASARDAWPLTYTFDFGKNIAEMRVSLPADRFMVFTIRPGMHVETGRATNQAGETLATLAKRPDGALVLRVSGAEDLPIFE